MSAAWNCRIVTTIHFDNDADAVAGTFCASDGVEFKVAFMDPNTGNGVEARVIGITAFEQIVAELNTQARAVITAHENRLANERKVTLGRTRSNARSRRRR